MGRNTPWTASVIGFTILQALSVFASRTVFLNGTVPIPPYFTGYAVMMTGNVFARNVSFLDVQVRNFNSDAVFPYGSHPAFTLFHIPESGVYWICLRPYDRVLVYDIMLNYIAIGRADRQGIYGPVGFARYLNRGDLIRVEARGGNVPSTFYPDHTNTHFSIALVQRLNDENDIRPLWTGQYRLPGRIEVPQVEFTRRAGITRPNRVLDNDETPGFWVPTAGVYWASIKLVPDGNVSRGVWTLNVNYRPVLQAWSKQDGNRFEGAYASRALVLQRTDYVTVSANYDFSNGGKDGFTRKSMVSLVRINENPTAEDDRVFVGEVHRNVYVFPDGVSFCSTAIPFFDVKINRGNMQINKFNIIIPKDGMYFVGLRNDPQIEDDEDRSVMKLNITFPAGPDMLLFKAIAYPPPDLSTPQGIDGVYYMLRGTRLQVCVIEGRRVDTDTILSVALIKP